jgi:hypothetical protein
MEIEDVFEVKIVPSLHAASTSARTDFLIFSFSTTASTTRSTSPKSP